MYIHTRRNHWHPYTQTCKTCTHTTLTYPLPTPTHTPECFVVGYVDQPWHWTSVKLTQGVTYVSLTSWGINHCKFIIFVWPWPLQKSYFFDRRPYKIHTFLMTALTKSMLFSSLPLWKSSFFDFLEPSFGIGFWNPFWWFGLSFEIPSGKHFGHFLGTMFASILGPF